MSTSATTSSRSGGIGLSTLLGVLFITLKLTGVIAWPWIWVLAPFWIGFAVFLVLLIVGVILIAIGTALDR